MATPQREGANVRGTRATFIRDNPRFVNEPIQRLVPGEDGGPDVASCLQWIIPDSSPNTVTCRQCSGKRSTEWSPFIRPVFVKESFKSCGVATLLNTARRECCHDNHGGNYTEVISYDHKYDCRHDPNQPIKGKLHGALILKNTPPVEKNQSK